MTIEFRHHDSLRIFIEVAQHRSLADAAHAMHMTKGALSYQVRTLEAQLGFPVFVRDHRGMTPTPKGQQLLAACQGAFRDIEAEILRLKDVASEALTVGMATYFAARWLSPRLMSFMQVHPEIQLRIQPMIEVADLASQGVDLAIRWGGRGWDDAETVPFLPAPAFPVGDRAAADMVQREGMAEAISRLTLLRDRDESNAWSDWLNAAALPHQARRDTLIIPDPNVRVQAVIDGQGIALMDYLVDRELDEGRLHRLSDVALAHYGYFLTRPRRGNISSAALAFMDWISACQ